MPSNLGLRPPKIGAVPGPAKAPEALREAGLHTSLLAAGAVDVGVVLPGRYLDDWRPGTRLRNEEILLEHAARLLPRVCGFSVTVFDPDLDPLGELAKRLSKLLADVLDSRRVVVNS